MSQPIDLGPFARVEGFSFGRVSLPGTCISGYWGDASCVKYSAFFVLDVDMPTNWLGQLLGLWPPPIAVELRASWGDNVGVATLRINSLIFPDIYLPYVPPGWNLPANRTFFLQSISIPYVSHFDPVTGRTWFTPGTELLGIYRESPAFIWLISPQPSP